MSDVLGPERLTEPTDLGPRVAVLTSDRVPQLGVVSRGGPQLVDGDGERAVERDPQHVDTRVDSADIPRTQDLGGDDVALRLEELVDRRDQELCARWEVMQQRAPRDLRAALHLERGRPRVTDFDEALNR